MRKLDNFTYSGVLADVCAGCVAEKRAVGLSYNTGAKKLSEFSRFSLNHELEPGTLPESLVKRWLAPRQLEKSKTRVQRYAAIRGLADYMKRHGMSAYMADSDDIGKITSSFTPYIFTHEEIGRFFAAADDMRKKRYSAAPRYHIIMPVIWKMLYCCGLRISEALGLLGSDVDLEQGILTIRESKGGKSRYVPMSAYLTEVCRDYDSTRLKQDGENDWLFTNPSGGEYTQSSVNKAYRTILEQAGISHGGRGVDPRQHDFRHTFAVHCLQNWIKDGKDLTAALPYLSVYLGHDSMRYTEPYRRMTAEVYPEVSAALQEKYGCIIPKLGEVRDEND